MFCQFKRKYKIIKKRVGKHSLKSKAVSIFFHINLATPIFPLSFFMMVCTVLWKNSTADLYEPPRDKTNNVVVRPAKTHISLGIRAVWSEPSVSAWRKLGSLATHWAHSEDSDQTGRMPRLIWVFARRTVILLISRGGSYKFTCNACTTQFVYFITQFSQTMRN